jgi:1-acyl-sn-glycerol-3-phosphate acyltransferase
MVARLRSFFGWIAWTLATIVFGSLALFVSWIPPRGRFMWPLARGWSRVFLGITGVRVRGEGPELPADSPFVFIGNHESLLDIPAAFAALPRPARFLAKKILFLIPFVGWNMHLAGFIPIDRGDRRKAVAALDAAARRMRAGNPILVFAEETRTRGGVLLPFQKGGFILAIKAQIPIVPLGIDGTAELMTKGSGVARSGEVVLRWGDPIPTVGLHLHDRNALMATVRGEVQRLRGGGPIIPRDVASAPGREELRIWLEEQAKGRESAPTTA